MANVECDPKKICPRVVDEVLAKDFADCIERQQVVKPADLVPALTEEQYESVKNNTGIYNNGHTNCDDLNGELLCDIRQDLEYILQNKSMTIFANDFSKCSDNDESPTLASMWSRIYRFSQATAAILCAYDPFIATLLKSGRYPQMLMGSIQEGGGGYPQWIKPDVYPTEGSQTPVSSEGVVKGIQDALLSVWHIWKEHPEFDYFAQEYDSGTNSLTSQTGMVEGDTALVKTDGTDWNIIYKYTGGKWVKDEVLGPKSIDNFSVTAINKGYYEGKEVYAFYDEGLGVDTWNIMDVDLGAITKRVEEVEKIYENTVLAAGDTSFILTTAPNLTAANAVACTEGKDTIVLITG